MGTIAREMTPRQRSKVVMCAEYQGNGAIEGSTTGFQRVVNEWINQAVRENTIDIVLYCIGTEDTEDYNRFSNVTFKQYKPNISLRDALPFIPTTISPFLVDLFPIHPDMVEDIIKEKPDVIHTFQTFGVTDISGYAAAKIMKWQGKQVRFINTVMGEVDTYFGYYIKRMAADFYEQIDSKSLLTMIKDSANNVSGAMKEGENSLRIFFYLLLLWRFCMAQENLLN